MRRREFITLLGGTAIWPVVARAQQGDRVRRVGVLLAYFDSDVQAQSWIKALAASLQDLGWNNGRNIQVDYRWGGPDPERLRAAAEELRLRRRARDRKQQQHGGCLADHLVRTSHGMLLARVASPGERGQPNARSHGYG